MNHEQKRPFSGTNNAVAARTASVFNEPSFALASFRKRGISSCFFFLPRAVAPTCDLKQLHFLTHNVVSTVSIGGPLLGVSRPTFVLEFSSVLHIVRGQLVRATVRRRPIRSHGSRVIGTMGSLAMSSSRYKNLPTAKSRHP